MRWSSVRPAFRVHGGVNEFPEVTRFPMWKGAYVKRAAVVPTLTTHRNTLKYTFANRFRVGSVKASERSESENSLFTYDFVDSHRINRLHADDIGWFCATENTHTLSAVVWFLHAEEKPSKLNVIKMRFMSVYWQTRRAQIECSTLPIIAIIHFSGVCILDAVSLRSEVIGLKKDIKKEINC